MLDYRNDDDDEPQVVLVDEINDYAVTRLTRSYAEFIRSLCPSHEFDDDDDPELDDEDLDDEDPDDELSA